MLKELFDAFVAHAQKSCRAEIIHGDLWPDHVSLLSKTDGTVEKFLVESPPRGHAARDLATIAALAKKFDDKSVVWYSRESVTLLIDDETRRDRATMRLEASQQLKSLSALSGNAMAQKNMIQFLRVNLAGCHSRCQSLVEIIRRIKFRTNDEGSSTVSQGKSSIGRSIEAEVTGSAAIPEEVVFDVPVWHGFPWRADVRCVLDADPQTSNFTLLPMAGEIELAIKAGEEQLASSLIDRLAEKECVKDCYYGSP